MPEAAMTMRGWSEDVMALDWATDSDSFTHGGQVRQPMLR
jgi:hypothetical protein